MPWGYSREGASDYASNWALAELGSCVLYRWAELGREPCLLTNPTHCPSEYPPSPTRCLLFFLPAPAPRFSWRAPGAGDLTGDPIGYVTGVLAVLVHAAYLVLIQKASADTEHGPLTAQYVIAVSATPLLVVCSFASTDSIHAWTFPGWKDPAMVCIFVACILIGCAMNFTTLHCTYINSAVTTSFVGVVKSIATITVGMVAFSDVEPTSLFIAGVVVNTLGSVIYCVAKFWETRKQSNYEDLETQAREEEAQQSGGQLPFVMEELSAEDGDGGSEGGKAAGGSTRKSGPEARGSPRGGQLGARSSQNMDGPEEVSKRSLKDAYLEVWRLVRGTKYMKKDYLIENEELPSP